MTISSSEMTFPILLYGRSYSYLWPSKVDMIRPWGMLKFLRDATVVDGHSCSYRVIQCRKLSGVKGFLRGWHFGPHGPDQRVHFEIKAVADGHVTSERLTAVILRLAARNEEFGRDDVRRLRATLTGSSVSTLQQMYETYRTVQHELQSDRRDAR